MLRAHPEHLGALVALRHPGLRVATGLVPDDSVLRAVDSEAVRPDAVFVAPDAGPWVVLEVQRGRDPDKAWRWPLAVSLLLDQRRVMGDLVVVTTRREVTSWAQVVVRHRGPLGSVLSLSPLVVQLTPEVAQRLLDPSRPELAFYAAWAVKGDESPEARAVIETSLTLTGALPPTLREAQLRAILNTLSDAMVASLTESAMNLEDIPESPAARALRLAFETRGAARGKAEGKAEAVLAVLSARGLVATEPQVAAVLGCRDATVLDAWLRAVASVQDVDALLASAPRR
ncbi:MAG: hypothetical protein HY909_17510 [Deltaproteobacteria bacterium]|nr:hypothetical protein [Deltaproteobacteria bacterium]